jgi:hypothetical protein
MQDFPYGKYFLGLYQISFWNKLLDGRQVLHFIAQFSRFLYNRFTHVSPDKILITTALTNYQWHFTTN